MMITLLGGKANTVYKFVCLVALATPFVAIGCGGPDYENAEPTPAELDPALEIDTTQPDDTTTEADPSTDPAISGGT